MTTYRDAVGRNVSRPATHLSLHNLVRLSCYAHSFITRSQCPVNYYRRIRHGEQERFRFLQKRQVILRHEWEVLRYTNTGQEERHARQGLSPHEGKQNQEK